MARPELVIGGNRPEGQSGEPQLPKIEAGMEASMLAMELKRKIKKAPEFKQALADVKKKNSYYDYGEEYKLWRNDNPFEDTLSFSIDNYRYNLEHHTTPTQEILRVHKATLIEPTDERVVETVHLVSMGVVASRQFIDGGVEYAKREGRSIAYSDYQFNTPTAVDRVKGFIADFGTQQSQTPPQQ